MCQTTADLLKTILHKFKSKQLKNTASALGWKTNQSVESPKNIPVYLHFMVDGKLPIKSESEILSIIEDEKFIVYSLNHQASFVLI